MILYFRMLLTMLVSLYTSRVVLNVLGVYDFGVYNVVGGVVSMFGFLNVSMTSATQRFLSYEIGKRDFNQLRKTFNVSQIIHLVIAAIILLFAETVGLWFVKKYLVIDSERIDAAIWVYQFTIFSFMLTVVQVPYNAIIIANERMNVYAYLSIIEVSLKLLIVFMLTWFTYDKLKLYGFLLFVISLFIVIIYRIYTYKNFKESKFQVVKDKPLYMRLISYSGWNLFGAIAGVAQGQGVNILLNLFFGPVANSARSIAYQVNGALYSFVSNFLSAVNPQIIKSFAANDSKYMLSLIIKSIKFSFYLLFLMSLPILLEVNQVLGLWLVEVPEYTSNFTILTIINFLFWPLSNPFMTAIQATGKIRSYQVMTGTLIVLIFPITYLFFKLGYPAEVTYVISIIIEIVVLITRLVIVNKLLNISILYYIKEILMKSLIIVLLSVSLPLFLINVMDANFHRLLVIIFVSLIWSSIIIYNIGLTKSEKKILFKGINKIIRNKSNGE